MNPPHPSGLLPLSGLILLYPIPAKTARGAVIILTQIEQKLCFGQKKQCKHCGNVITKLTSAQVPVKCCGEEMHVLEAGVTDAAQEKHVPAVTVEGSLVKVDVGSVTHPMTAEHFIQWVVVETERDALIHWFHPEEAPEVVFALAEGQTAKAVYAYCNLHGLWKKDL